MTLEDQIPGLREAIERENSAWDAAWLGLNESICGIEVKPYTPRHDLILGYNGMRSPFVCGQWPETVEGIRDAVEAFMWTVSPQFGNATQFQRMRFNRRIARYPDAKALIRGIRQYVAEAFEDAPASSGPAQASYYSWFAGAAVMFSKECNLTPDQLIDRPFKQIFQLTKVIRERNNPDCHLFKSSDRIQGEWLAEQNKKLESN